MFLTDAHNGHLKRVIISQTGAIIIGLFILNSLNYFMNLMVFRRLNYKNLLVGICCIQPYEEIIRMYILMDDNLVLMLLTCSYKAINLFLIEPDAAFLKWCRKF